MNKNKELIYYKFITILQFIHLYKCRANPLFLTFENLIPVEKQLYREMLRGLSVFWSRGFAGKTHPLKNVCFALFLPLFGLFLPLFSPFWGVRAMRLYGGYGRLARSKLLKTPSNPQSDLASLGMQATRNAAQRSTSAVSSSPKLERWRLYCLTTA